MKWMDEPHEVAAWLVLGLTAGGVGTGVSIPWTAVCLALLALLTLVGSRRFRGLEVGVGPLTLSIDAPDGEGAE